MTDLKTLFLGLEDDGLMCYVKLVKGCLLYLHQLCLHAEYATCKSRGSDGQSGQSVNELETKTAWIRNWHGFLSPPRKQAEKTGEPLEDATLPMFEL